MSKKPPLITDFDNISEEALVPESEQPYEIPAHWRWVWMGNLINLLSGRDAPLARCNDQGVGIPYVIGASNFTGTNLNIERWIETPEVVSPVGSLLLTVKGTVGKLHIQEFDQLNLSRQVMALVPGPCLLTSYLYNFMSAQVSRFEAAAVGLIPGISRSDVLGTPVSLPPLDEQKRIVEYIQEINAKIDDVIQRLEQYLEEAPARRAELILAGVRGALTERWRVDNQLSREDWTVEKLGNLGDWGGGGTPSKSRAEYWEGGTIRWVTPKDMKFERIDNTLNRITELGANESNARKYTGQAVCMVTRSGILRRILPVGLAEGEFTVNQDMKVLINVSEGNLIEYIFWLVTAHEADIRNTCSKSGTTVESIDFGKLKEYQIELPSRKEQEEIIRQIRAGVAAIDGSIQGVVEAKTKVESLREQATSVALMGQNIEVA